MERGRARLRAAGLRRRNLDLFCAAPQPFKVVIITRLRRENVNQQVTVIGEDPFRLAVSFHAQRRFARLLLQLQAYLIADRLDLALIRARADHEVIGK